MLLRYAKTAKFFLTITNFVFIIRLYSLINDKKAAEKHLKKGRGQTGRMQLMKYKALLGSLVAAGIWSAPAAAGEVAVIKPEDQAVLEGIFAFEPVMTGTSSLVPAAGQEDGYGIQAKGARDVSRVQALPLVTKAKSGDTKAAAQAAKTGNTRVTAQAADVAPGNNLKAAMTAVVEGKESEKAGSLEVRMTHEEIARQINSAREVVARMLKRFSADGLVELRRGAVRLKNPEALRKI